jgi:hypothetical protein
VTGPYSPVDVPRDLVDAAQSLQSAEAVNCCWLQEPEKLHWNLRRRGNDLEVEFLEFRDIDFPGHHRGEVVPIFKARANWVTLASQLLSSLESIETDIGV